MRAKPPSSLFPYLVLISIFLLFLYSSLLSPPTSKTLSSSHSTPCNLFSGKWVPATHKPLYNETCPFQRNAWNCLRNQRPNMGIINSYKWVPESCDLPQIDPVKFMSLMRDKNIGLRAKPPSSLFPYLVLISIFLLFLYSSLLSPPTSKTLSSSHSTPCNLFSGKWVPATHKPLYNETCPFQRNAWNCLRNQRPNMGIINSYKWVPESCDLPRIDPVKFMSLMRDKNIGFVGDSLNENFFVSFLCVLRGADPGAKKWKRKGAWRGGYFPKYNVTVAYHRAVLLANYRWQPKQSSDGDEEEVEGVYRVDVDIPAVDWASITKFYDVLVFNTGHWWGFDKFPKEKPLVFYRSGEPINPPLGMMDGLKVVLENMVSHIEKKVSSKTLKFWRLQSPRHFHGGEWNQNGSCLFDKPLEAEQLDLWFDPSNNGVNKEARQLNLLIQEALRGTSIQVLDLTHLSEFRADAHPAIWLGKKDAVAVWGQDCMHWCLPGVPDTWVDILSELIRKRFETGR